MEKDYGQLIAAHLESERNLKIRSIQNTLTEEKKKKKRYAFASGICFAGTMAATLFSGIDPSQTIPKLIQSLNSFDTLKEYREYFTPAMVGTMITTIISFAQYIRHKKKYDKANQEFYDMDEIRPEDYQDIVEHEARSK